MLLASTVIVLGVLVALVLGVELSRTLRRRLAGRLEEPALRQATRKAGVLVSRSLLDGPKAGVKTRTTVDLLLSEDRLLVVHHQGRLMEIRRDRPGSVRSTGPRRLVIEGRHPVDEALRVRVELIDDDVDGWVEDAAEHLGTRKSAMAG